MPICGSQIILCDIPIRFDTYEGCGHACSYCFVSRKSNIANIKNGESATALREWVKGKRIKYTNWCDWDIPLHWGGLSDPFQPIEKERRRSLEALKVFAETRYPFVVSTKNKLIADEPYFSLISRCNCVVQFSIATEKYDQFERGASTYEERLTAAAKLSKVCRVVFRVQPYLPNIFRDVLRNIPKWAETGVHGIILEGMKYTKPRIEGLVSVGADWCYPIDVLLPQFRAIKEAAHRYGLKFYCGENRLRALSDELCCCGIEGMGWRENKANLNHFLFDTDNFIYTDKMKEIGTAMTFGALEQTTIAYKKRLIQSYKDKMEQITKTPFPFVESSLRYTEEQKQQLREYLCRARDAAGITSKAVDKHLGTKGMAGHYFGVSQWEFPTLEAYEKMREILPLGEMAAVLRSYGVNPNNLYKIYGYKKQ